MASLSIPELDERTLRGLRMRAAEHGVSVEEEVRRILRDAVGGPESLGDFALELFGAEHGVELELPPRSQQAPPNF